MDIKKRDDYHTWEGDMVVYVWLGNICALLPPFKSSVNATEFPIVANHILDSAILSYYKSKSI